MSVTKSISKNFWRARFFSFDFSDAVWSVGGVLAIVYGINESNLLFFVGGTVLGVFFYFYKGKRK